MKIKKFVILITIMFLLIAALIMIKSLSIQKIERKNSFLYKGLTSFTYSLSDYKYVDYVNNSDNIIRILNKSKNIISQTSNLKMHKGMDSIAIKQIDTVRGMIKDKKYENSYLLFLGLIETLKALSLAKSIEYQYIYSKNVAFTSIFLILATLTPLFYSLLKSDVEKQNFKTIIKDDNS